MDIEEFIKIEEPYFKNQEQDFNIFPCPMYEPFYDQESVPHNELNHLSIDQVLTILQEQEGFVDASIDDLTARALNCFELDPIQIQYFKRRIRKIKNIMKRDRARNRKYFNTNTVQTVRIPQIKEESQVSKESTQLEKQIKKQRNRISAQISRDRKKNYINTLEQQNKQLESEAENLKRQNEKLKKQIQSKSQTKSNFMKKIQQSKFVRFLIMLGLVFFLYIIKDTLKPNKQQIESIQSQIQLDNDKSSIPEVDFKMMKIIPIEEEQECLSVLDQNCFSKSLKGKVISAIQNLKEKTGDIMLPLKMGKKIQQATQKRVL